MKKQLKLSLKGAANLKSTLIAELGRGLTIFRYPRYQFNTNSVYSDFMGKSERKIRVIQEKQAIIRKIPLENLQTLPLTGKVTIKEALASIGLTMRNAKHAVIEEVQS